MTGLTDLPYFPRPDLLGKVFAVYDSGLKQGVTLFAPRRQGKTLFARRELIPAAEARNWRTAYLDLWARRSQPDLGLVEGLELASSRAVRSPGGFHLKKLRRQRRRLASNWAQSWNGRSARDCHWRRAWVRRWTP